MKNKIKHFLVDLEELQIEQVYDSEEYQKIRNIRNLLEELIEVMKL